MVLGFGLEIVNIGKNYHGHHQHYEHSGLVLFGSTHGKLYGIR